MKDKLFSVINILGLAISLFAVIYIVVFLTMQFSFDKHHKNAERIYRLESRYIINDKPDELAVTQIPLGPALSRLCPAIEYYVRIAEEETMYFRNGSSSTSEDSVLLADVNMFKVFTHPFIYGDPDKALTKPFSIVLTKYLSQKYFPGIENPLGDTLEAVNGEKYIVTGVIENVPETSHLGFNALVSFTTWNEQYGPDYLNDSSDLAFWGLSIYTYILLSENASISAVPEAFDKLYNEKMKAVGDQLHASFELLYTPLLDIRFNNKNLQADVVTGNKVYMLVFILVAIIIFIIAGINYMNLATARANTRAKEIGLRKIAGSTRRDLVKQFMSESFIFSLLALILALLMVQYTIPFFNEVVPFTITFAEIFRPTVFLVIVLISLLLGIFSGSLPALYLSSLNTVAIIRGNFANSKLSRQIRRMLVIIQFSIASVLLILLLVIQKQTLFLVNHNLGFNKENVIAVSLQDTAVVNRMQEFKTELMANNEIIGLSVSSDNPGFGYSKKVTWVEMPNNREEEKLIITYEVDSMYLPLFQIELLEGRNFGAQDTLKDGVLINQFTAEKFGWFNEDYDGNIDYSKALGKIIKYGVNPETGELKHVKKVIGVFKNYYFSSLHFDIEPLMLVYEPNVSTNDYLNIRFSGNNNVASFNFVKEQYKNFKPLYPFNAVYIQDNINDFYTTEKTLVSLLSYFTALAMIVSALGLLGMISYVAQQRRKEIGVKKVLGSTAFNISVQLIVPFIKLVVTANLISWPIAWLISSKWLDNFVFSIPITWKLFALSLLITSLISILIIMYKVVKASTISPSNSLRYE